LEFHVLRGDLSRWTREVLGCPELANSLDKMRRSPLPGDLRGVLLTEIDAAIKDAEAHLYRKETKTVEAGKA
jgi:hypothetical protein